jgi:hypothetical protein
MSRVEIPAPGDLIMDTAGNVLAASVSLKIAGTSTDATHYSALTGGTSTTGGLVSSASDGTIVDGSGNRRYVDDGTSLDLTILGRTRRIEPVAAKVANRVNLLPANAKAGEFGPSGALSAQGAIADGTSRPLSGYFASLAAAQAVYPHATSLTDQLDWAALRAAQDACYNYALDPATNTRTATRSMEIPAGSYNVGSKPALDLRSVQGLTIHTDGLRSTKFLATASSTCVASFNGIAHCQIGDFSVESSGAAITVDIAVHYFWDNTALSPTQAARSCANNTFGNILINDCRCVVGMQIGRDGDSNQVDSTSYGHLLLTGATGSTLAEVQASMAADPTLWQSGLKVGSGVHGNNLLHHVDFLASLQWKYNLHMAASSFSVDMLQVQMAGEADIYFEAHKGPFHAKSVRSEGSNRFILSGGGTSVAAEVTIEEARVVANNLNADGRWISYHLPGKLRLLNTALIPFFKASGTATTNTSTSLTSVVGMTGAANGDIITGSGILAGTTIASGAGTGTITLSQATTSSASGVTISSGPIPRIYCSPLRQLVLELGLQSEQIRSQVFDASTDWTFTKLNEFGWTQTFGGAGATDTAGQYGGFNTSDKFRASVTSAIPVVELGASASLANTWDMVGSLASNRELISRSAAATQVKMGAVGPAAESAVAWGSAGTETLYRVGSGRLAFSSADMELQTVGKGIRVKEGSNAKQGVSSAMVAGTVTVANTAITASSRLLLTRQAGGTNPGAVYESTRTAGTSFVITSTNASDTGTVAYQIFEPAA